MIIGFEAYQPQSWCVDGLIVKAAPHIVKTRARRSSWKILLTISALGAGILAVGSLFFSEAASASSLDLYKAKADVAISDAPILDRKVGALSSQFHLISPPANLIPAAGIPRLTDGAGSVGLHNFLAETSGPLESLFESIRNGVRPTPSASIRRLADSAAKRRNEKTDVDAWSRRLADDVKDATD